MRGEERRGELPAQPAKRFGPVSVRYTSPSDMQFGIKRGGSHARTLRGGRVMQQRTEEFGVWLLMPKV